MNDQQITNDYILDREMIFQIRSEFDTSKVVAEFAKAIQDSEEVDKVGENIFSPYSQRLARRALELGEERSDLMFEEIKRQVEKLSGRMYFPFLPERFIEIAYLSIFPSIRKMTITEANERRLSFKVAETECNIYSGILEKCGEEVGKALSCRHGCLRLLEFLYSDLKVEGIKIKMLGRMPTEKYCEFECTRAQ